MEIPVIFSAEESLIPRINTRIRLSSLAKKEIGKESISEYFKRISPSGYWGYLSVTLSDVTLFKINMTAPALVPHKEKYNFNLNLEEDWWVKSNLNSKEFPELFNQDFNTDKILMFYNIVAMGINPVYINLLIFASPNFFRYFNPNFGGKMDGR